MKTITPAQCRAARALLRMDQQELADRANVARAVISSFENEERGAQARTVRKITDAIERKGIVLIDDQGVSLKNSSLVYMEGKDWFVDLLEDVYFTLRDKKDAELLVEMGNDRITAQRPAVLNRYRKIRNAGVRMRQLICEEDRCMLGPMDEYRWVPRPFYKNWVTVIYGDKVALSLDNETRCGVFLDADLAERRRNDFDLKWSLLNKPDRREVISEYF